jgi:hypothetical protein
MQKHAMLAAQRIHLRAETETQRPSSALIVAHDRAHETQPWPQKACVQDALPPAAESCRFQPVVHAVA